MDRTLLIVYHSQSGNTEQLSQAVEQGALGEKSVTVRRLPACAVTAEELCNCRALVICSPEYFGYMAGAVKDMFDRTYEQVRPKMLGKSYTIVVSAGNDGSGALASIERIVAGFKLKKVQEPVVSRGAVLEEALAKCRELGQTLAAGMAFGIY
ncbi:MAG: NAD(P)H-dependent oxidoreductase [Desulfomonile tiedjei]|uniref:NAD(P)H-dependent oxidoreductase n=1 Tax=Desulfomonile tiedjei TaxID=2358 RepID=A0A9D6V9J2_9BACT|nr:NAD(P)H-dependent oxidoreductase [Desulfomonile tiedjei]